MTQIDTTKCKCWKRPFEPPHGCFDYCAGKILRFSSSYDMQNHLNIEEELADRIYETTSNENLIKLSDFKPFFTDKEFNDITIKIQNLDHNAQQWLKESFNNEMEAEIPVPA